MGFLTTWLQNLMCMGLFFCGYPRRSRFAARLTGLLVLSAGALCAVRALLDQGKLLVFLYYLVEFGLLMVGFHCCFQTSWEQALYSASAGRAAQHLIYSVLNLVGLQITGLSTWQYDGGWPALLGTVPLYLPFCAIIYLLFARRMDTSR